MTTLTQCDRCKLMTDNQHGHLVELDCLRALQAEMVINDKRHKKDLDEFHAKHDELVDECALAYKAVMNWKDRYEDRVSAAMRLRQSLEDQHFELEVLAKDIVTSEDLQKEAVEFSDTVLELLEAAEPLLRWMMRHGPFGEQTQASVVVDRIEGLQDDELKKSREAQANNGNAIPEGTK